MVSSYSAGGLSVFQSSFSRQAEKRDIEESYDSLVVPFRASLDTTRMSEEVEDTGVANLSSPVRLDRAGGAVLPSGTAQAPDIEDSLAQRQTPAMATEASLRQDQSTYERAQAIPSSSPSSILSL